MLIVRAIHDVLDSSLQCLDSPSPSPPLSLCPLWILDPGSRVAGLLAIFLLLESFRRGKNGIPFECCSNDDFMLMFNIVSTNFCNTSTDKIPRCITFNKA